MALDIVYEFMSCIVMLVSFLCLLSLHRIGLLLLDKPLDRETTDQYRLVVTASDGHIGGVRQKALFLWVD